MIADSINSLNSPWNVIAWVGCVIGVLLVAWLLMKLSNMFFSRLGKKHKGMHVTFLQHLTSIVIVVGIVILAVSAFSGVQSIWQTLLGGTAIVSAVIAFVAQDVIKDILAGIMLSFYRPFVVGDRISLEDGSTGIVEEMTMRHVVICPIDTVRVIIPNSKINAAKVVNYSYHRDNRSAEFNFSIGYDSDMELARNVIKKAIESSKYSIPGLEDKNGKQKYADVYFMKFADSALILHATVYYENSTPSAVLINDINIRVREALIENNIEIPYNYVSVVSVEPEKKAKRTKIVSEEYKVQTKPEKQKETAVDKNKVKIKTVTENKKVGKEHKVKIKSPTSKKKVSGERKVKVKLQAQKKKENKK